MHTIVISGPRKNALGTGLMQSLLDQVVAAAETGEPLLLTGEGDAFSAGLNLAELLEMELDDMRHFHQLLEGLVGALYHYPGPTAAAVNGHAIAGGMILATVCDHRVATTNDKARLGLNEVALGLRFPPRLIAMLRNVFPVQSQIEILLGAGLHPGWRAAQLGVVDRVDDDPVAAATAWLEAVAPHPDGAYAATKAELRPWVVVSAEQEARFEQDALPAWVGDAIKARIAAFLGR